MLKRCRFLPLSLNHFIRPMSDGTDGTDEPHYTSDAQPSKESIRLSQYQWQPANIWFKNTTLLHPNDEQDIERQASTDEENAKEKRKKKANNKGLTPFSSVQASDMKKFNTIPQGRGTVLAVIDSGINAQHKAFAKPGKIIDAVNFKKDGQSCQDETGHGTECAGIACGLPFTFKIKGEEEQTLRSIAPEAKLMVLKVADKNGYCNTSICRAIEYIIQHNKKQEKEKVNVISLSFGSHKFNADLAMKIQHAITNNIIVVSAASNHGASIINPISYPGKLGHVICVGACNERGKPTDFTPEGREIDCLELGENVWVPTFDGEQSIRLCQGTSYSAPIVAACICLIIEDIRNLADAYNIPDLLEKFHNVWCMREILKMMAVKQGHHDRERGYGRLNPTLFFEKIPEEKLRILLNI